MTVTATLRLRPVQERDEAFLFELYASTREEELGPLEWSAAARETFLRQQFEAQSSHYRQYYPEASFDVIELEGRPIGRLYVARWDDEIRIVDISLVPEHRGRGIGSHLLLALMDEAAASGARASIHVERFNAALRLYERLGFVAVADRGVYLLMEARPGLSPGPSGPRARSER